MKTSHLLLPLTLCITVEGDNISSLKHPLSEEIVDEMTKVLCYMNKDVESRFINPQFHRDHDDNPNSDYFDTFDYLKDKAYRAWKESYNQNYKKEKKEKIKKCLSNDKEYQRLRRQINRLDIKISKSRGEKTNKLREKRREAVFKLSARKKFLCLPDTFL